MAIDKDPHDDRVLESLVGRSISAEDHLLACEPCRSEQNLLAASIRAFSDAARETSDHPTHFWTRQAAQIHSRISSTRTSGMAFRYRMTSALAALAIAALLLLLRAPVPQPEPQLAIGSASDHELLLEVERALQRDTPAALEPVTLLVEDISGTTSDSAPSFSKEQSHHAN
jgi:hypothetical protein